jgi:hypothetical protein
MITQLYPGRVQKFLPFVLSIGNVADKHLPFGLFNFLVYISFEHISITVN